MRRQLAQFRQRMYCRSAIHIPFLPRTTAENAHAAEGKVPLNRPNAYGVQHRECLQGTREKTLSAISEWFDDESTEKWIFFFLDVAGSGKSTVAKHMAEKWKRESRLLARFFFSRDTTATMSTDSFCSTVANAFAALDPKFKEHMEESGKRPDLELLSFEERFECLVVHPLRAIGRRAILIIDALDECHLDQRDQMLEVLRTQHSSIPLLRVFVTGRPERDIQRWANDKFGIGYMNFILLEKGDNDVELYIKHRLQDQPIAQDRLYPVIRNAEGLFIWARIACDLILKTVDIDGLLEELGKEVSLDYLYKVALEQSTPKEGASRRATVLVLQMILAAREPLSIAELEILSPKRGVVENVVTCLSSVLLYQGREDPIRLLHATFREFLTARSKADIFFIQPELGHHTLASGCLTTISNLSRQDNSTLQESDAISQRKEASFEQDTY
jgi:NACHT domain